MNCNGSSMRTRDCSKKRIASTLHPSTGVANENPATLFFFFTEIGTRGYYSLLLFWVLSYLLFFIFLPPPQHGSPARSANITIYLRYDTSNKEEGNIFFFQLLAVKKNKIWSLSFTAGPNKYCNKVSPWWETKEQTAQTNKMKFVKLYGFFFF